MATEKNHLSHHWQVSVGAAVFVDRVKLRIGKGSDLDRTHPVSFLNCFGIGTDERGRAFGKGAI